MGSNFTVDSVIMAGFAAMTAALGTMWKVILKRLNECEQDKKKMWNAISELQGKSCSLECSHRVGIKEVKLK